MPHDKEQLETLPPAIIDALRDLDGPAVLPDAKRDAELLSGARQHLAQVAGVNRKRRNLRLFFAGGAGGALAAAVMIAAIVWNAAPPRDAPPASMTWSKEAQPQTSPARPAGDLDANGTVDILDAYRLAVQVQRGKPALTNDFNNDGRVDQLDIDLVANQAVALNTGERG